MTSADAGDGTGRRRDVAALAPDDLAELLVNGELEIAGRLSDASNVTLLAEVSYNGLRADCVYKPIRGERPLWDFPDGSLAGREVAAALVAHAAGWECVPPTFLRDGPVGTGMVQLWIDDTDSESMVDLFSRKKLPAGWLPVLRATDATGSPAVLAHADDPRLQLLATFDLVVNNADRKGPHVLPVVDGPVYGVDHGLTLHADNKLRTVLWGWAGDPLPEQGVEGLRRLQTAVGRRPRRAAVRAADDHRGRCAAAPRRPAVGPAVLRPAAGAPDTDPVAAAVTPPSWSRSVVGAGRYLARTAGSMAADLASAAVRTGEVVGGLVAGTEATPGTVRLTVLILSDERGVPLLHPAQLEPALARADEVLSAGADVRVRHVGDARRHRTGAHHRAESAGRTSCCCSTRRWAAPSSTTGS